MKKKNVLKLFDDNVCGIAVRMVREEGVLALYKGNGAQMVRIFPYGAIQFSAYELFKKMSRQDTTTTTNVGELT